MESIGNIETKLPSLRGKGASFASYVTELERVEAQLNEFYNGSNRFKRHKWDARRAKDAEYRLITDRLLKLVEGQIGRKREETNKVVIGVGLGKPSTKTRISSLHESFQSYFVQKARSLGYIVVGVNEYDRSESTGYTAQPATLSYTAISW
ncbi:hypothetical protein BC939DRAFT_500321 [Gamsiella multidivaricata]|uniref:uncharacterized protein n=1 Tax=Gamsiella multidivaricata TaxID=101098 RepID=UPI00222117BC|nr:uncharacterized protein BC939DRAFT_500321 [Gamsiella multidivaricata]KAI7829496.1 hypothetical protein BC939DRAFT_500321 [Gamsiella multidivaricata]